MKKGIALFGGTFDPIHIGHLQSALEVQQYLDLLAVRLIPSFIPPHRESLGSEAEQRLEMVRIAVQNNPALEVDDREILRQGPSYTYDTLTSIRDEVGPDVALIMVLGLDSFVTLSTWHRWRDLLASAHILVLSDHLQGGRFLSDRQTLQSAAPDSAHAPNDRCQKRV